MFWGIFLTDDALKSRSISFCRLTQRSLCYQEISYPHNRGFLLAIADFTWKSPSWHLLWNKVIFLWVKKPLLCRALQSFPFHHTDDSGILCRGIAGWNSTVTGGKGICRAVGQICLSLLLAGGYYCSHVLSVELWPAEIFSYSHP